LGDRKKTEWWVAGVVICLEQGADLHMTQLMPLPLTVSCFSKIQIGFTFLVVAHPGSPGKGPLNGCVCVCVPMPGIPAQLRHLTHANSLVFYENFTYNFFELPADKPTK